MSRRSDSLAVGCVLERDGSRCARCGLTLLGERGVNWAIHHRRPRRAGGDRRPDVNLPSNLVALHQDCHEFVEQHRTMAYKMGLLLRYGETPSRVPVVEHAVHGFCYLGDDGSVFTEPPDAQVA